MERSPLEPSRTHRSKEDKRADGKTQGAAVGAAIGAGVGVTTTLATKGPDLEFKESTQFTVRVSRPVHQIEATAGDKDSKSPVVNDSDRHSPPVLKPTEPTPNNSPASPPTTSTPAQPATPAAPSSRYRAYASKLFRLSIPDNWGESSVNNSTMLAPNGGNSNYQGQLRLTRGVMCGVTKPQSKDLQQAADQFIGAMLQSQPYLHKQAGYRRGNISGRIAVAQNLSGLSDVTRRAESVTVYLIMLRNGSMFYMTAVAPQDEYRNYQPIFASIVRSIQIND